jgi:hypothetical protein
MMLQHLQKYANQFVFILRNSIPMPLLLGSLCLFAFIIIVNLLEIPAAASLL